MLTSRSTRRAAWAAIICLAATAVAQTVPLDALLRGARIHYQGGRYDRALEQFEKARQQYGQTVDNNVRAEMELWIALCHAQLKRHDSAAIGFVKAIGLDSSLAGKIRRDESWLYFAGTSLLHTARESYETADYDAAVTYARTALVLDPTKPQIYSLIAGAFSAQERYEEMLATARSMISIDTSSAEAYGLIGLYFLQKPDSLWADPALKRGRWDSTLTYYRHALEIYARRAAEARNSLGTTLKLTDKAQLAAIAESLVAKSRSGDPAVLDRYIEQGLKATKQRSELAAIAARLFFTYTNLNVTGSRAGSAMLRASAETRGDTAERYRALAESLFIDALVWNPADFNSLFNLGIARYQARSDSLAADAFARVVAGATAPLTLLEALQDSLLALVTPANAATGYAQLPPSLAGAVDSILFTRGFAAAGFSWLYFPQLKDRKDFIAAGPGDAPAMFVSIENPSQLENIYLLLGVSQTGHGLALLEAKRDSDGRAVLEKAIANLLMVTRLNPANAESWQNLVHCYRETGQKQLALDAYAKYERLSGKQR
uniref:Tetratricopeptide repeat protein n=1 Tax=candidate division WOR-3 bacterium TaxID=2052148 RepID=A0A7C4GCS9_UNCW3